MTDTNTQTHTGGHSDGVSSNSSVDSGRGSEVSRDTSTTETQPQSRPTSLPSPDERYSQREETSPSGRQSTQNDQPVFAGKYKTPQDLEKAYKDLESKIGEQGQEVGRYRSILEQLAPFEKDIVSLVNGNANKNNAPQQVSPEEYVDNFVRSPKDVLGNEIKNYISPIEQKYNDLHLNMTIDGFRNNKDSYPLFNELEPMMRQLATQIDLNWTNSNSTKSNIALLYREAERMRSEQVARQTKEIEQQTLADKERAKESAFVEGSSARNGKAPQSFSDLPWQEMRKNLPIARR